MGRRTQPGVESGKSNPILVCRRYPSDNIHGINIRTDFEEIAGANNDGVRNASTAEDNSDDRRSDGPFR